MDKIYKVAILGAGPGGYAAAIRAAQFGLSTCLIEKNDVGGVCLNQGCIPTKALIKAAQTVSLLRNAKNFGISADNFRFDFSLCQQEKDSIVLRLKKAMEHQISKNSIDVFKAEAKFIDQQNLVVGQERVQFEHCIIAVGAKPRELSTLKFDRDRGILSSQDMLALSSIPKSILVVGGGYIGCEFAYIFRIFGSEVTIVEIADHILPTEDEEIARLLATEFKKMGIKILSKSCIQSLGTIDDLGCELVLADGKKIKAEKVLLAVGRVPNTEGSGLDKLSLTRQDGSILVDERMQTNLNKIYAVGDVAGKSFLAHVASHGGIVAVENIAGLDVKINYHFIPRCIYTQPQIASVGLTVKQAQASGIDIKIGKCQFLASGKAVVEHETRGLIKIINDAGTDKIIGAHILGSQATELIHEMCVAMQSGLSSQQFSKIIHAHPTYSEALSDAIRDIK